MPASSPSWCRLTGTRTRTPPRSPWWCCTQARRAPATTASTESFSVAPASARPASCSCLEGHRGEGDLAPAADAPVERRPPRRARELAPQEGGQVGLAALLVGGVAGSRVRRWWGSGSPAGTASHSIPRARRMLAVPSASAWCRRQTSAVAPSSSARAVDPPQRPVAVQVLREQACHLVAQPRPRARARRRLPATTCSATSKPGSGTHSGAASEPPRRRVRAGAASSRGADRLAQLRHPGGARAHQHDLARVTHHGRPLQRQDRPVGLLQRDAAGAHARACWARKSEPCAYWVFTATPSRHSGQSAAGHDGTSTSVSHTKSGLPTSSGRGVPARAQAGDRDHLAPGGADGVRGLAHRQAGVHHVVHHEHALAAHRLVVSATQHERRPQRRRRPRWQSPPRLCGEQPRHVPQVGHPWATIRPRSRWPASGEAHRAPRAGPHRPRSRRPGVGLHRPRRPPSRRRPRRDGAPGRRAPAVGAQAAPGSRRWRRSRGLRLRRRPAFSAPDRSR